MSKIVKPFGVEKLMRIVFAMILVGFVSMQSHRAHATITTGNKLHEICDLSENRSLADFCFAYIIGSMEQYFSTGRNKNKPLICIKGTVKYRQVVDIVKNFLEDNPEIRHENASVLIGLH